METRTPHLSPFSVGDTVIYGVHGRCTIQAIESKTVGDQTVDFYKMEPVKPALSRSTRPSPAIWLPVQSQEKAGLRAPLTRDECESLNPIFSSREYYFDLKTHWHQTQPKLDEMIAREGAIGLAKVVSYLFVRTHQYVVVPGEQARYYETACRLLYRELSDALAEPMSLIQQRTEKLMKPKLTPSQ